MQMTCFIPERQSSLGFQLTNSHTDSSRPGNTTAELLRSGSLALPLRFLFKLSGKGSSGR